MDAAGGPLSASSMMESLMACGRRLTIRQGKEHNAAWAAIYARCSKSAPAAIANIERGRRDELVHCSPAAATSRRFSNEMKDTYG